MNERIKDLAEQAGISTNLDTDFFEKDPNKWVDYFAEKFAELIVAECAGVLVAEMNRLDGLNRVVAAQTLDTAQVLIKQHFGVEE